MRPFITTLAASLLVGCSLPMTGAANIPDLAGQVDFGSSRQAQATIGQIGREATVSLIGSSNGQTIRTTLTNSSGQFLLTFGTWRPSATEVYYLEAIKGLNNNQAGNSAARVRTLGKFVSGRWATLTNAPGGSINLTSTTTAVSIIASHLGTASVNPDGLMNTVAIGNADVSLSPTTPDSFAFAGTGITNAQFHQVYGLVEQALTEDSDPVERVVRNGSAFSLKSLGGTSTNGPGLPVPTLYTLVPTSGAIGTFVTLYGKDFESDSASNSVSFNGVLATPFSSEPTKLVVQVPSGATTGAVTVRTRGGTSSGATYTVTPASATDITGTMSR